MPDETCWISTGDFARLAEISPQAAGKALRQAFRGQSWRGTVIEARHVPARGGRGGVAYEVALDSLPERLRSSSDTNCVLTPKIGHPAASRQGEVITRRWTILAKILEAPHRSPERARALAEAIKASGYTKRTLYRWIERYEERGLGGLGQRRKAGPPRAVVSRAFDRALRDAGQSTAVLAEIGAHMERSLKGLWSSRAEAAGWREIRRMAEFLLLEACEARGLRPPPNALRLSRRGVERFAPFRVVNRRRNDRKAFDDAKPRIRRDWTMLAPMERVVADVKHLDIIVRRPDGTLAWPKIVAFMDAGTGRVFVHPVLLASGEGVRQEHVIEGFLAMVSDPNWGFPRGLYLDNGSEFAALVKIQDALNALGDAGARTVIFARPYNAAAKPIESLFARLDRYVFSLLPGYAGPNRMAQKTQTVGKPPAPFDGPWEEFCEVLRGLIGEHHRRPVGGLWRNRSPEDWFTEKLAGGSRPIAVHADALDAAFCDHDSRRIDRGVVKVGGRRYTHPALSALPGRTAVDIALPWRRDAAPLARLPDTGWVRLQAEAPFPARWLEGAHESSRRQQSQTRHVAALAREAPLLDPVAVKLRMAERGKPHELSKSWPRVDLGAERHELGAALAEPTPSPANAAEARRQREMALTERLERKQRLDE